MEIAILIQKYGYLALFLWTAVVEGETAVALAGLAAFSGHLSLSWVIVVSFIAAVAGDQALFWIGRKQGTRVLKRKPQWKTRMDVVHKKIHRYRDWFVVGSRFAYGFRFVIPIAIGTSDISWRRFTFWNSIGASMWATGLSLLGYFSGQALFSLLGEIKRYQLPAIIGVIALIVIVHLAIRGVRKFNRMTMEENGENTGE